MVFYLMNVFDNKSSWHIIKFSLVNIQNFIRNLQAISIGRRSIQFYFSITSLNQNYDISLQFNDLLQKKVTTFTSTVNFKLLITHHFGSHSHFNFTFGEKGDEKMCEDKNDSNV